MIVLLHVLGYDVQQLDERGVVELLRVMMANPEEPVNEYLPHVCGHLKLLIKYQETYRASFSSAADMCGERWRDFFARFQVEEMKCRGFF